MKPLLLFLVLLAAAGRTASAQDVTNAGGTLALTNGAVLHVFGTLNNQAGSTLNLGPGGQLHVGGNFVNAGTLVPGTGAVLLIGPAAQTLDLAGATLYDLTVNSAAAAPAVAVPSNATVTHQLTLVAGLVRTAPTATITLPAGAALLGETSARHVAGNLRMERGTVAGPGFVDFGNGLRLDPGGNALGAVAVVRTAGLQLADVSYGVNPTDPTKKGIDQVWQVLPATQPTTPVVLELSWWAANDNGLTAFASAQLWRRTGGGWGTVGPLVDASSRTLAQTVAGPLGQFTVSTAAVPLPVKLVAFATERRGESANLCWRTASERNNDYFGVEVSPDGRAFRQFARVAGQGNASTPTDYELPDPNLLRYGTEVVYYRLRQVDRNGAAAYSPVAVVAATATGFAASAAPNPLGPDGTQLRVVTGTAGPAELAIYNALGRLVLSQRAELPTGTTDVDLRAAGKRNQYAGVQSGWSNTIGDNNYISGYQSGYANTASNNHFEGYQSGTANTMGTGNQFVGYQSGYSNTNGGSNQFSGYQSGYFNTTGSNNAFVGTFCGYDNTTGSGNTALGNESGPTSGNLSYTTTLGYRARVSQSNSLVLGGSGAAAVQVGIGTPAPAARLHVYGAGPTILRGQSSDAFGTAGLDFWSDPQGSQSEWRPVALRSADAGNFTGQLVFYTNGTGFANRQAGVEQMRLVNGGLAIGTTAVGVCRLNVNGTVGAGGFATTSDQRLKTDIRPLTGALALVQALHGRRYRWNALGVAHGGTAGREQVGLLAQELARVLPELVSTGPDGYQAVNYPQLAPVLIEALKEQQQ